jgi:DNA-binding response OmpR family regulator/DNA-binding CsgD family transcriptional regulator
MKETKILIADDLPEHIKVISDILLKEYPDYKIYGAADGKSAYELAKIKIPHLIIMDWDMPVMNGLESTIQIKSDNLTKDIPIIIASGLHTSSEAIMEALGKGAVDYIRKPIDKLELVARVRSMLRFVDSLQQVIQQKEINFEQEINFKIKELSSNALSIAKQNEFLTYLIEQFKKLQEIGNSGTKKLIYDLIGTTNRQLNDNVWENFEQQFSLVYSDFYNSLGRRFPNLTPNERKLCSLLRMNLSSKEIANITFQEASSVDVARYRLRQKLGLGKDDNLVLFLTNLGGA